MSDYDDVYLVPKGISSIRSRGDVDLKSDFLGLYPIMSSPMAGISGSSLVIAMGESNCLGILHRFDSFENRLKNIDIIESHDVSFGVAIGINNWENEFEVARYASEHGACMICVDIANGYVPQIKEVGKELSFAFGDFISLMCGNVITREGAQYAQDSRFDFVRVGIGSGNLCSTRTITGVGRNQLCAISECSAVDINIVSDGGINSSGQIAKALAIGSDFVMIGSALAMSLEAENNGRIMGMASRSNHINNNKEIKSIEGIEKEIDNSQKMPLRDILDQFLWGLKSTCTYLNCESYKDIPNNCDILPVDEKL